MIIKCCCCCRQISPTMRDSHRDKYLAPGIGAVYMGPDKVCCGECAKDLDEFGLFPEERDVACKLYGGAYCDEPKKYR